jgi:hypothetical protein
MRKLCGRTTRQRVGGRVHSFNETLSKLPPAFNDTQKVLDTKILDILATKAQKPQEAHDQIKL